jgi:hypothetical protein
MQLGNGGDGVPWFFLAMADRRLDGRRRPRRGTTNAAAFAPKRPSCSGSRSRHPNGVTA